MLASDVDLFVDPGSRELQQDSLSLVSAVSEGEIHEHDSWPTSGQRPLVVIGRKNWLRGQLSGRAALQPSGAGLPEGSVQVWARRDKSGRLTVLISLDDIASVKMLERRLPHYGSKSFIVFVGGDTKATGVWQEPMTTTIRQVN
jgi:hypothetical protein